MNRPIWLAEHHRSLSKFLLTSPSMLGINHAF
jgi:hypothetical protein